MALLTAVSVQYYAFLVEKGGLPPFPRLAGLDGWSAPVMAGVLTALVPWELLPRTWRDRRAARAVQLVAVVALLVVIVAQALDGPREVTTVATWALCISATVATAAVVVRWWRDQRSSGDPLPAWLAAGTVVAWLAIVVDTTDLASWRLPGRDIVDAAAVHGHRAAARRWRRARARSPVDQRPGASRAPRRRVDHPHGGHPRRLHRARRRPRPARRRDRSDVVPGGRDGRDRARPRTGPAVHPPPRRPARLRIARRSARPRATRRRPRGLGQRRPAGLTRPRSDARAARRRCRDRRRTARGVAAASCPSASRRPTTERCCCAIATRWSAGSSSVGSTGHRCGHGTSSSWRTSRDR